VPTFTVDSKGRITGVSSTLITGAASSGAVAGDLSGALPSPTVIKINGNNLGTTTPTAGNLLIGDGSSWSSQNLSGDITLNGSGVAVIGNSKINSAMILDGIIAPADLAAGLYAIDISGNAATASAVDWNNVANKPINLVLNDGNNYNITVASSSFATLAANANHAITADSALSAATASTSSYATLSGYADTAATSTYATNASHADQADNATNAGTVTNGVYTTGSYTDPSWLTITPGKIGLGNVTNALQLTAANNLSDLTNTSTARTNLGLADSAVMPSSTWLQASNNFSDLTDTSTARTNLGLGSLAILNSISPVNLIPGDYSSVINSGSYNIAVATSSFASLAQDATHALTADTSLSANTAATSTYAFNSGNSDTVTNGVYTTGSYTDPSWLIISPAKAGLGNVANALQLTAANNLSDITDVTSARTNLGLGSMAVASSVGPADLTVGDYSSVINSGSYNISVSTSSFATLADSATHALTADNAATSTFATNTNHAAIADSATSADTVTNGVFTNGSYADPTWLNISQNKIGLSNVENTKLSAWLGSGNITNVGTIASGTWQGSPIDDSYISSAANWNNAFSQSGQWTGQTTGLNAALGRTSLGLGGMSQLNNIDNSNWSGAGLSVVNGGTGNATIGSAGTLAYSNGTSYDFTQPGNAGQILLSQGSGTPQFADLASLLSAGPNLSITGSTTTIISVADTPTFTSVNGLSLVTTAQGISISGNNLTPADINLIGSSSLQNASVNGNGFALNLLNNAVLDQDLTTTSSPAFGNLTISGNLGVSGTSTLSDVIIGGILNAAGTANFNSDVNVSGTSTLSDLQVNGAINTASGAYLSEGGTWTNASSRDLKENFTPIDTQDILTKIDSLPITRWNYKTENIDVTHIGPMAQDFYAAFNTGGSKGNISISTIDPAGVALAGIQALSQKLNDLGSVIIKSLRDVGVSIENGIVSAKEFVADKITAKTVATNGLEMKDTATGQVYCIQITNGDFAKTAGNCTQQSQNTPPASNPPAEKQPDAAAPDNQQDASSTTPSDTQLDAPTPGADSQAPDITTPDNSQNSGSDIPKQDTVPDSGTNSNSGTDAPAAPTN
jgi:hypothetical protein